MAEKKFLDFLDRFDGGGMGKSGEKFEGGGLLSMLGNLFADPYGSEDKARMASRDAFYGSQDIGGPEMTPAPAVMNNNQAVSARPAPPTDAQRFNENPPAPYSALPPTDAERFGMNPPAPYSPAPPTDAQRFNGNPPAPYSPTPVNVGAPPSYTQPSSIGMPPAELSQEQVYTKFGKDMVQKFGNQASAIMSSPNGLAVFNDYVRNGYRLPDM